MTETKYTAEYEQYLKENKILCLKQLRLSKWQLIWNREFEIMSMKHVDEKALAQAELGGRFTPDEINKAKDANNMKVGMCHGEIEKAKIEITMLDQIIKELKNNAEHKP